MLIVFIDLENNNYLNIQFAKRGGFIPVVVQDFASKEILMLAYANEEALKETIKSGYATFWKTSGNYLWKKGETSGNMLKIQEIKVDCDQDALIYIVKKQGEGACHTRNSGGKTRESCFYRSIMSKNKLKFTNQEDANINKSLDARRTEETIC